MLWVTMTDKFMSGWGRARGRTNKLIFECQDNREANIVVDNAEHRSEMRYINVCCRKPHYSPSRYLAQVKTREDYDSWYQPGYFAKGQAESRAKELSQ